MRKEEMIRKSEWESPQRSQAGEEQFRTRGRDTKVECETTSHTVFAFPLIVDTHTAGVKV